MSKSDTPESGSRVVTTQRPTSPSGTITASPIATCLPSQVSSSCGSTPSISNSIRKRRPSTASVGAGLLAQPVERAARDQRRPAAAIVAAVLRAALRPEQRQRLAGELRQRLLPRARHEPRRMRRPVQLGRERLARLDRRPRRPSRRGTRARVAASLVPLRPDPHELGMALAVDEPAGSRRRARSGGRPRRRRA